MMTGAFSSDKARKVEASLPDNAEELCAILAHTLRHIIREAKRTFKQNKGLFNMGGASVVTPGSSPFTIMREHWSGIKEASERSTEKKERMDLFRKILDKLHDVAHATNDTHLIDDVEKLDDCLITTQQLLSKQNTIPGARALAVLGLCAAPLFFLVGIVGLIATGNPLLVLLSFFYGAFAAGGFWLFRFNQNAVESGISEVETAISELAERRQ
jgi:hypothetical protein